MFTAAQYNARIQELHATTMYNIAREARIISRDLAAGTASTATGINFHFSVFYLQRKGAVDSELGPVLMLDFCGFVKDQEDFEKIWNLTSKYYPDDFQHIVGKLLDFESCTLDGVEILLTSVDY